MATKMKFPAGIQDFAEIRGKGYVYVDKTRYIRESLDFGKYLFLSRPRRFGKSLFISTLERFFEGRRDLFKGLDVDSDDTDWTPHPVIKFSLNTINPNLENSLDNYLESVFREYETKFSISNCNDDLPRRFEIIIKKAYESAGHGVVILVDEYDSPLLNTLDNEKLNNSSRDTLRSIFAVLKNADAYIHFAFITGVSRFSHTSLFSGANNLFDISLLPKFSAICGITDDELRKTMMPGIQDFAENYGVSPLQMLSLLKENYDGYHFSETSPDIYNPYSLLKALQAQKIDNYWFQSGTPASFLKSLAQENFYLPNLDCVEITMSGLSSIESFMNDPITLLYETGYLTIKDYDDELQIYTLALPNKEVAVSFSEALIPYYSGLDKMESRDGFIQMRKAITKGDPDKFMLHLQTFLEGNPYGLTELAKREKYFENNIFLVFKALGFLPRSEEQTCSARMDIMLRTRRFIYIFELKTDVTPEAAMRQIEDKGYALPYADEGKTIFKIAANYSSKTNNISGWIIREDNKNCNNQV